MENKITLTPEQKANWNTLLEKIKQLPVKKEETPMPEEPTLEERITALTEEVARLKEENETIGAALEETIAVVLGGAE